MESGLANKWRVLTEKYNFMVGKCQMGPCSNREMSLPFRDEEEAHIFFFKPCFPPKIPQTHMWIFR